MLWWQGNCREKRYDSLASPFILRIDQTEISHRMSVFGVALHVDVGYRRSLASNLSRLISERIRLIELQLTSLSLRAFEVGNNLSPLGVYRSVNNNWSKFRSKNCYGENKDNDYD